MLSRFGKFVRKLRIDRGELLKDMADKLGVTPSYLSAVETGRRPVPEEWVQKIATLYGLNEIDRMELKKGYEESKKTKIELKNMNNEDRKLLIALARDFNNLPQENKETLKQMLKKLKDKGG